MRPPVSARAHRRRMTTTPAPTVPAAPRPRPHPGPACRLGPPPIHSTLLSARLQREWAHLAHRPHVIARARSWGVTSEPFDDLDQLLRLSGMWAASAATALADGLEEADGNDVVARLVAVARDDELAARIVLQRMLPGLLGMTRRRAVRHGCAGVLEELVTAAWIVIRTYPIERRPHRVVGGMVRDAWYRAFVAPARRRSASELAFDPQAMVGRASEPQVPVEEPSATEELAELLAAARDAGVDEADLELMRDLVRHGSSTVVAAARNVTSRTIRNHRAIVAYRLRKVAAAA